MVGRRLFLLVPALAVVLGGCSSEDDVREEPGVMSSDYVSWFEVTALKVRDSDRSVDDAFYRISSLEGVPVDDGTWESMRALASAAFPGPPDVFEPDETTGSVRAGWDTTQVEVVWHGRAMHIYYTPGTDDAAYIDLVDRLYAEGYLIAQGNLTGSSEWAEVPRDWNPLRIERYQTQLMRS
jgi:hypothetical protein